MCTYVRVLVKVDGACAAASRSVPWGTLDMITVTAPIQHHGDCGSSIGELEQEESTFLFSAMDTTVSCLSFRSCWSFKAGKLLAFPVKANGFIVS